MKYSRLGVIQIAILNLLREDEMERAEMERAEIYKQLRTTHYTKSKSKCQSRQAFRYSINGLKRRHLIEEHYGILVLIK